MLGRVCSAHCGVIALLAVSLGACSSTVSSLPKELGGLPENTPARPATQLAYPAVHDMPPPRAKTVMTEEEVKQTEADLAAAGEKAGKPATAASRKR